MMTMSPFQRCSNSKAIPKTMKMMTNLGITPRKSQSKRIDLQMSKAVAK